MPLHTSDFKICRQEILGLVVIYFDIVAAEIVPQFCEHD